MEVTRANYGKLLPDIQDAINKCCFISIDCEFTGLYRERPFNGNYSPGQYYKKIVTNAKDFLLVQFGLTIFSYDDKKEKFLEQSYNFFVFPHRVHDTSPNVQFVCDADAIEFLSKNGFDFNKGFKEGIPYLNANSKDAMNIELEKSLQVKDHKKAIHTSAGPIIEEAITCIKKFIASDMTEHILGPHTKDICNLILQHAPDKIDKGLVDLEILAMNEIGLHSIKATRAKTYEEKLAANRQILDQNLGLSRLITHISQSRKPIVGHNLLLDICHIVHQFVIDIPEELLEFEKVVHDLFPMIYDTKYIGDQEEFKKYTKSSILGVMVKALAEEPFGLLDVEATEATNCYNLSQPKNHEAGFDAFVTGHCFLAMWQWLKTRDSSLARHALVDTIAVLDRYANRIRLARYVNGKCCCIDLAASDRAKVRNYSRKRKNQTFDEDDNWE